MAIIVLEGSKEILIEQSHRFKDNANNNHDEHEILITWLMLENDMGVINSRARNDS